RLQHTVKQRFKDETEAVERNKRHLTKNRANADIPDVLKKGTFEVSCSRGEEKSFYAERTLTIQHKGSGTSTERTIPHLQFTDWDEIKNTPRSTKNFLSFLNVIENVTKQQDDGPILVHCL
ncbi:PTN3-like protein, partial [Mya arenaria]